MTDTDTGPDGHRAPGGTRADGEPERMLPAAAYTSPEVLAWEQRHLFAGSWTCLGRVVDLFPPSHARGPSPSAPSSSATSRPCWCTTVRRCGCSRTPAVTAVTSCSPVGDTSQRHSIICPYHAWTYDLGGALIGAKGFRDDERFDRPRSTRWSSCPCRCGRAGSSATPLHPLGSDQVPSFTEHLGDVAGIVSPYAVRDARARRPAHL